MNYLALLMVSVTSTAVNFVAKRYNAKCSGAYFYTMLAAAFSAIIFSFTVTNWSISINILLYALYFAIANCVSIFFIVKAYRYGLFSLTVLIMSYSLLIPTFFGIIFLHEQISVNFIVGLLLVLISIFLTSDKVLFKKGKDNTTINPKWILCVLLAFIGGGMCSVTQRLGQNNCSNINLIMVVAFCMVAVYSGLSGILFERKELKCFVKDGWYLAAACGILNGITNHFVIILNTKMKASIMFPVISAFMLVVSFIFSICFYKEKLSRWQIIGYIVGTASVIILNL